MDKAEWHDSQKGKPRHSAEKKEWKDMSKSEKAAGLIGLTILAVVLFLIVHSIASSGHSSSNQSDNSQPTQSSTASTDSSAPASPSTSDQIAAWHKEYGYIFTTLGNDTTKISTDAGNEDVTALKNDCTQWQADIKTAQSLPAIPDAQSASDYSSGLTYDADAAQDCIDGTANYDASLIIKSNKEMSKGIAKFYAAAQDIKAATGQ